MNAVREGAKLKNQVWIRDIITPAAPAQRVAQIA